MLSSQLHNKVLSKNTNHSYLWRFELNCFEIQISHITVSRLPTLVSLEHFLVSNYLQAPSLISNGLDDAFTFSSRLSRYEGCLFGGTSRHFLRLTRCARLRLQSNMVIDLSNIIKRNDFIVFCLF